MNNKQTVVIRVLGKRISIKGSRQTKISTIFPELKKAQKLPYEPDLTKIEIINSNTYQILQPNTTFGSIVADRKSGAKEIQIRDKDQANRKKNIQFVQYDVLAEQAISDVLTKIIFGDYDVLLDLGVKRKISPDLQALLGKICQKYRNTNHTGGQKQKQESMKIQKLELELKERQQQLSLLKQQIDRQQQQNKQLQKKLIEDQKIKQKFKQAINKEQISQIMPNDEEQDENNQSILYFNDLIKQVNNKFAKKIKPNQKQEEEQDKLVKNKNKNKNQHENKKKREKKMYDLLHHSRTFDIQVFGSKLQQYSQKLGQFVEEFTNNEIKQIVSVYFIRGPNIEQFISKIKQKNNFIMLFSSGDKLFGIFSSDTFGVKVKSESGFLFCLSDSKKYALKPGNPIWKYSNVEVKIGNDALIFSQQTKKEQMKMRIKKPLSDSFNIQQQEIRAMIGGGKDHIIIDSFEFLTVSFVIQPKQQKRELKHQGRSLKTQASD